MDLLAGTHGHMQDRAGAWRRDFHDSLVRLYLNQWLVRAHTVTLFDEPAHDLTLVNAFTNVREAKFQCHADLKRPGRDGLPQRPAQSSADSIFRVGGEERQYQTP